jgi:outer membrane protein OmpA-like peptidoglycan-associated protein
MKTRHSVELEGFHDGESDFRAFIVRRTDLHVPEVTTIIDTVVEAFENSSGDKSCAVVILGHSDQAFNPPLELVRSQERADTAAAWLLDKLNQVLIASSQPPVASWRDVDRVAVEAVGLGAAHLLVPSPANEFDRQQNRRVVFLVTGTNISSIAAFDGTNFTFGPA